MSVHQLGGTGYRPGEVFRQTLKHEKKLWVVRPGIVTVGRTLPSRESLIADAMTVPRYVIRRVEGEWVTTGPTFWNAQRAARAVDAALGQLSEAEAKWQAHLAKSGVSSHE